MLAPQAEEMHKGVKQIWKEQKPEQLWESRKQEPIDGLVRVQP